MWGQLLHLAGCQLADTCFIFTLVWWHEPHTLLQEFTSLPVVIPGQNPRYTDVSFMVLLKQNSLVPSLAHGRKSNHISNNCWREEKPAWKKKTKKKNWWVSTERNAGTATGAVCDWSIAGFSKPFFSHRHVQRVDKRHHPTDSLINCEMCCYLLLSYSEAPRNPPPRLLSPASPTLPVRKRKENKLDSIRIPPLAK